MNIPEVIWEQNVEEWAGGLQVKRGTGGGAGVNGQWSGRRRGCCNLSTWGQAS